MFNNPLDVWDIHVATETYRQLKLREPKTSKYSDYEIILKQNQQPNIFAFYFIFKSCF